MLIGATDGVIKGATGDVTCLWWGRSRLHVPMVGRWLYMVTGGTILSHMCLWWNFVNLFLFDL